MSRNSYLLSTYLFVGISSKLQPNRRPIHKCQTKKRSLTVKSEDRAGLTSLDEKCPSVALSPKIERKQKAMLG
jgi:hypothetical protein